MPSLLVAMLVVIAATPWAAASAARAGWPPATSPGDRPVCKHVGTRSEGWGWPSGGFIHWAKCKGVVPQCRPQGHGREVEGWYGNGTLIVAASCRGEKPKR